MTPAEHHKLLAEIRWHQTQIQERLAIVESSLADHPTLVDEVIRQAADIWNTTPQAITTPRTAGRRSPNIISDARCAICCVIVALYPSFAYSNIARRLGLRCHTNIRHYLNRAKEDIDPSFQSKYSTLKKRFNLE